MAIEVARHRFTVDEYLKMGETGILTEDDRVELIDGEIIQLSPIGDRHVEAVNRCSRLFAPAFGAGKVIVSVQNPRGQRLSPLALPDVEVAVDDLLPPPDLQD